MDIETYFPYILSPISKGSGLEPLFPNYIFCKVDPSLSTWPFIKSAPGISYFLGNDREPFPLNGGLIEHMKMSVDYWNQEGFKSRFAKGDHISITNGPFRNFDGFFLKYLTAPKRCLVLLKIMGQMAPVALRNDDLMGIDNGTFHL